MDFNKLKKKRGNNLKETAKKLEEMNKGGGFQQDERIYKPGFDKKEEHGYARVRLIPAKEGENFVRRYHHQFKGKKDGFYWEVSRTTIGEKDPVGISNALYWKAGDEAESKGEKERLKKNSQRRKRNTKFFVNVYVEKDDNNPEAVGKVMIMECGKQIWDVVEKAVKPKFEDQKPIDPFDMWEGAPLIIRVEGKKMPRFDGEGEIVVPNYEESSMGEREPFMDNDEEKMKEIFEKTYDLSEFSKVKSFEELAKRFEKVEGEPYNKLDPDAQEEHEEKAVERATTEFDMERNQEDTPDPTKPKSEPHFEKSSDPQEDDEKEEEKVDDDEDDALAEFRNLVGN